jgi:hypothetical protein
MAINRGKRISELTPLTSASLDTTIVGVDNGTTYKIELDVLADAVTSRVNTLDRDRLSSLESVTSSFETKGRSIVSGSSQLTSSFDTRYVVSGSVVNIPTGSFATTGSNTFTGDITMISSSNLILRGPGDDGISGSGDIIWQDTYGNEMARLWKSADNDRLTVSFTGSHNSYVFGTLIHSLNLKEFGDDHFITTSSFNSYTASQSTSSLVNRLNTIESVSGSWITESETGSFLTSLSGAISSSEQVLGNSGVYSSSAQINGNIYSAGSSFTIQDIIVGAGTTFGKITTDGSKYISVMPTYNTESSRFWANGNVTIQDGGNYVDNGFKLEVSGSTRIVGSFNTTGGITGSTNFDTIVNKPTLISGSSQLTSSFDARYTLSGSVQNIELPSNLVSGSSQLTSSLDGRYLQSGSSPSSDSITFNRTAGINVTEGQMAWNNSDGTLDIGLNYGDVVLQVGQEQHYVVRNSTGTTIPNGTAVYASGVSVGSKRIEVSPFTANGIDDEIRFLGLATHNILDGVNGIVSNFGYVRGLDTRGTSATAISVGDETWAEGDILYAHPTVAGKLTKVAPKDKITVAMITTRHQTTGVLFVRPSSFGHIDDLHDVQINTNNLVTGSMLEWNGGYFVNNNTFSSSVDTRFDTLEATIISGSPNYTQVLGNKRTGINSVGISIISGSITTNGNPVQIMVTGDANPIGGAAWARLQIYRDGSAIGNIVQVENSSNLNVPYSLNVIDTPSAGTYVYSMRLVDSMSGTFDFGEASGPTLTAVELNTNTNLPSTNNTFTGTNRFNGQVTLGGAGGDEGGEIQLAIAQTNTTLTGSVVSVDIYQDRLRIFEAGGNARGVHIDLSKAPSGNAGELMWKASGMVAAGTFVTLDNLKATITTSGSRGLSIGAVSTSFDADINVVYTVSGGINGGSLNNQTYTTTESTSLFSLNFLGHGDTAQFNLRDKTNNRFYRITMMIGVSYISNFISIERLF